MNGIKSKRCSVPGCQNKSSQRHRFPIREPGIFQEWLKALNYAPFFKMTPHQIYNSHYVCHQHFAEDVTVPGTKRGLKVSAVPTLFLPENVSVNNNNDVKVEEKLTVLQNIEIREWDNEFIENVNITCDNGESSLMEKYYQIETIEIKTELLDDTLRLIDLEHDYSNKNISAGNTKISNSCFSCENIPIFDSTVGTVDQQNDETNDDISQTIVEKLEEFLEVDFEDTIEEESIIEKPRNNRVKNQKHERSKKKTKINQGNTYFCSTCMESFTVKEDYDYHLEIHPPYVCEFCGKAFKRKDSLRAHRFTHNNPNSFICEVCGKGCKEYNALRCHLKTHRSDKSYICDKCSKMFKTRHHLLVHIKYVHNKDYKDQCSQCGLRFRGRAAVRNHIRLVHLKVKPYECDVCQRKFGRPDYLRQHKANNCCERELGLRGDSIRQRRTKIIVNDNDELRPCKFCGKVIQGKIRLSRHLYLHVNRYKCRFCSKSFVAKYNRNKHEGVHQNIPNFLTCNVCYRKFKSIQELEEHVATQIHRRQRKYFCGICHKRFHRRYLLSRHNLIEHVSVIKDKVLDQIVYENVLEDD